MIARAVNATRRRRATLPATAASVVATMAMFQPEIATTWVAPTVVNAADRSRSTRSRRPMRIPLARPASGSGIARWMARSAPRRSPSSDRLRSPLGATTVRPEARIVAPTPIRARYAPYGSSAGGARRDPASVTRSPGTTIGNPGRVLATRRPAGASNATTASCWPARGALIVRTSAVHGPRPAGSSAAIAGAAGPGIATERAATRRTPIVTKANQRRTEAAGPRDRRLPLRNRIAATVAARPLPAPTATTRVRPIKPSRTRMAPTIAPSASQPLPGTISARSRGLGGRRTSSVPRACVRAGLRPSQTAPIHASRRSWRPSQARSPGANRAPPKSPD